MWLERMSEEVIAAYRALHPTMERLRQKPLLRLSPPLPLA